MQFYSFNINKYVNLKYYSELGFKNILRLVNPGFTFFFTPQSKKKYLNQKRFISFFVKKMLDVIEYEYSLI